MYRSVAIITHEFAPFAGGIATYVKEVATVLVERGVPVEIIAPYYEGGEENSQVFPVVRALTHHRLSPSAVVKALRAILCHPKDCFLHAADIRAALLLLLVRLLSGRRYGVMIHGSEVSKLTGRGIGSLVARIAYQKADVIFANSQSTLSIFEQNVGKQVPGRVSYLGIEARWFDRHLDAFERSDLEQLAASFPYFCTVARIERRKGQDQVIRAMAAWSCEERARVAYVVAGPVIDEAYRAELAMLAEELGVKTIFTGLLSENDLKTLYRKSVCHVLPALPLEGKMEGFGFVSLEAGAQDAPSVANRTGGIPEVVLDQISGILVDVGDIVGLSIALKDMLTDRVRRNELGKAAGLQAVRFTWKACVEKTYKDIVSLGELSH
ncbi:MAG: glycosyltransferase family 4 protein [Parvibaculum sp.]|nr:glycosyltransferase family 4 protein [Parvibaculum sp.]